MGSRGPQRIVVSIHFALSTRVSTDCPFGSASCWSGLPCLPRLGRGPFISPVTSPMQMPDSIRRSRPPDERQPCTRKRNPRRMWHWFTPGHLLGMIRYLWSSEVSRAAVASLDPRPGETILDLGAGMGPATYELTKRVGPTGMVYAVDPSRAMRAIQRLRRLVLERRAVVSVRPGVGEALPLPDRSIDAALALNVMHHLKDITDTAIELARVLRPGGRLLLADEDFGHHEHRFQRDTEHQHAGPDFVDPAKMARALGDAGFVDVDERHAPIGNEPAFIITATRGASA